MQPSPFHRLWRLLKTEKKHVTAIYAYAIFNGLVNLSIPLGIQAIVNLIQGGQVSTSWIILVFIVVLGVASTGILQYMQLRLIENMQQRLFVNTAFDFADRTPRLRQDGSSRHFVPEWMNRFFDTVIIQKGLAKVLVEFSTALLQVIFGLLLLSLYHPFFIAFSVILVGLVFVIMRFTARRGFESSMRESTFKYRTAHWLQEIARSRFSFLLAGNTDLHLRKTDENLTEYLASREVHFRVLRQQYLLLVVFKSIVAAALLLVGGVLVLNQTMNIGQFIAAEIIILLVLNSVEKLILSIESVYDLLTALEKTGQVSDMETETQGGSSFSLTSPETLGIQVEFAGVTGSYPGSREPAFRNLSFRIDQGNRVALSGLTDSSRQAFSFLLNSLTPALSGKVILNGLPIGNFNPGSIREYISGRLFSDQLFEGTIMENITMGRSDIPFSEVQRILEVTKLSEIVQQFNRGLDTPMLPCGQGIAEDTRQKILLARSLIKRPRLLILETGLEFIRQDEKKAICSYIMDRSHTWTVIVTSQDAELLQHCDIHIPVSS